VYCSVVFDFDLVVLKFEFVHLYITHNVAAVYVVVFFIRFVAVLCLTLVVLKFEFVHLYIMLLQCTLWCIF